MSFFMFFLRITCQTDFKMCPYRYIWSSKMMLCRLFVVLSKTLFSNDSLVIWAYFLMSAVPGSWKRPARKHLKPFWQHIMKKHTSKSRMGAKMSQKRPRLGSKWTTWPPPQLTQFHPSGPLGDTCALKSQKTRSRHTDFMKSLEKSSKWTPKNNPNASEVVEMVSHCHPNQLQSQAFSRWGAFL